MLKRKKNEIDDSVICKIALAGNTNAFRILIEKYQTRVYNLGLSFLKNPDDADDFVQDVMVKAYTHLHTFLGKSQFSTWLMSIAYNTAINSSNKKKEYTSLAENYDCASMTKTPEQQCIERDILESVKEAVHALPDKHRVCIDLYFFYDMPYADIEVVTGLPINTIKSHVFRAKKILKKRLESRVAVIQPNIADSYAFLFKKAFSI
ncbi:MAG: sigma-70 family RNA polymerase sigma factor [Spirochaetaceae bacterium]|nr:sigma-70 family RNA polymerase sigma factor [Spirochaetaceae bacterium]